VVPLAGSEFKKQEMIVLLIMNLILCILSPLSSQPASVRERGAGVHILIKNIIFDLGNVLVHVDFDRFDARLRTAGVSEKDFNAFFSSNIVRGRFEKGLLSTRQFLRLAVKKLGNHLSQKELLWIFQDMFDEKPDMKKFLVKLVKEKKYKLIMLSNTNPIHYNYGKKHFRYIYLIKNRALSYKLKLTKPDRRIYLKVLKRYRIKPEETLFIDDKQMNCDAAETLGIKTIHFTDYKSFLKQFKLITE